MDIVTHAMMGTVIASPWLGSRPVEAACFVFGSVLPDLDALSRVFGPRAFLRFHQTYTHSFLLTSLIALAAWPCLSSVTETPGTAAAMLAAGMWFHISLDLTNTYGITPFAPLSLTRRCTEWVFFIDVWVIGACAAGAFLVARHWMELDVSPLIATSLAAFLLGYWIIKAWLYRRAWNLAPLTTQSLIPSGVVPWSFLGCSEGRPINTFSLNGLTGSVRHRRAVDVLDDQFAASLAALPEFKLMRELSPGYHVVDAQPRNGTVRCKCRDLRIRNFNTRFGELEADIHADGTVERVKWHV